MDKVSTPKFRLFTFFAMMYMMLAITDMILIYRMISIDSFVLSAGVFIMSLMYFIEDVIAEIYGYKRIRQVIWSMLFLCFIFSILVTALNFLPGPAGWHRKPAFDLILGHVFRINLFGGGFALLGGAFINGYVISRWKVLVRGRYFWLRSIMSSAVGQLVQNILGCLVLYIGIYPLHKIFLMILPMYFTQIIGNAIIATPGLYFIRWIKHLEGGEIYDKGINYNPFKLSTDDARNK